MARRLARRRTLTRKNGAAICAALSQSDAARRYELGVEALCQLTADVVALSVKNRDAEAPASHIQGYWGISYAVLARPLPDPTRTAKATTGMLVWMCLTRAIGWMTNLVQDHSRDRWQEVQEMMVAWQDAWGNDARARYAQARFTTLTGIVRGAKEKHYEYMHSALVKALSDIQA
jgi:hypothetical protein